MSRLILAWNNLCVIGWLAGWLIVSDRSVSNVAGFVASNGIREWGAISAKMAFAILWGIGVILAHLVKKAALLYIARQGRKSLREVGSCDLCLSGAH